MIKKYSELKEIRRNVAGIDLACRAANFVCGPRNDNGECEIVSFGSTTPEIYRMLKWLQERNVISVAMESTSVYWIPMTDIFESNGIEVVLVDARSVRMLPGRKSDMKDCQWLQQLHSYGLLQGAFRPSEDITAIRSILREKENLTAMRVQAVQQMHKSLDQMNIRPHHAVSEIDGKTGTAIIEAILQGERDPFKLAALRDIRCKKSLKEMADDLTGTWRTEHLFNLENAFKLMRFLDEQIAEYDKKVSEMYKALAEKNEKSNEQSSSFDINTKNSEEKSLVVSNKRIKAKDKPYGDVIKNVTTMLGVDLTLIPGVGARTVAILISELGLDFSRFKDVKNFISFIGLAPALNKSAGKNIPMKKKSKCSSRVGNVLRMCAASQIRAQTEFGAFYRSVAQRTDKKTAIKATARRIAKKIYYTIKYGIEYVECSAEEFEKRMREKVLRTVKKLINKHNINKEELIFI